VPRETGRLRFRLVKKRRDNKSGGAARTGAQRRLRTKIFAATSVDAGRGWGWLGWAAGLIHASPVFERGTLPRSACVPGSTPGARRLGHFHDREPQRRGPLRCPADLYDASERPRAAFTSRQHWSRLALVSSQTVRRLSHTSNTQHAASVARAALAPAVSAEKQMRDLV